MRQLFCITPRELEIVAQRARAAGEERVEMADIVRRERLRNARVVTRPEKLRAQRQRTAVFRVDRLLCGDAVQAV